MRMPRRHSDFLLSRRGLMRGLGAAAIVGLPSCGAVTVGPPSGPPAKIFDGYADQQSYRPGDRVTLFLSSNFPQRTIMHLHDYTGRPVFEFTGDLVTQTAVGPNPWETGFGYQESAGFTLPDLPSAVYMVEGLIPVIVKTAPAKQADVVILYPSNTMAAYNTAGGRSMYSAPEPAPIVSFQRPAWPTNNSAFLYSFLRWFSGLNLPYSFRYLADIDLEDYNEISGAKLLVVIGHSEYWTRRAREHFDEFVLGGGNVLLLSGNNMWWQVRYSDDRSQMICYKRDPDPVADALLRTVNWPLYVLHYPVLPSIGGDFEHGGFKGPGFRVLLPNSPVFRGVQVHAGDLIWIPTTEYDGTVLLNNPVTLGEPRLDLSALGAYRAEIIGYSPCSSTDPPSVDDRVGTWIAHQRTATSGVVMNGGSTNWCSNTGVGGQDGERVQKIILNMIDILANQQSVFVS
jgi:hypothetical protein